MNNIIENQNAEALENAFEIEVLEERLETAPWSGKSTTGCSYPACSK